MREIGMSDGGSRKEILSYLPPEYVDLSEYDIIPVEELEENIFYYGILEESFFNHRKENDREERIKKEMEKHENLFNYDLEDRNIRKDLRSLDKTIFQGKLPDKYIERLSLHSAIGKTKSVLDSRVQYGNDPMSSEELKSYIDTEKSHFVSNYGNRKKERELIKRLHEDLGRILENKGD